MLRYLDEDEKVNLVFGYYLIDGFRNNVSLFFYVF